MGWLIGIGITVVVIYLLLGVIQAIYEASQTSDPFKVSTVFTWLYKMFK